MDTKQKTENHTAYLGAELAKIQAGDKTRKTLLEYVYMNYRAAQFAEELRWTFSSRSRDEVEMGWAFAGNRVELLRLELLEAQLKNLINKYNGEPPLDAEKILMEIQTLQAVRTKEQIAAVNDGIQKEGYDTSELVFDAASLTKKVASLREMEKQAIAAAYKNEGERFSAFDEVAPEYNQSTFGE